MVLEDALPVNVTLTHTYTHTHTLTEEKKSYYLVNVLPNIIDYSTYTLRFFISF